MELNAPAGHFDGISSLCSKVKKPDFGEIDQINYVFGLLVQSKCVFFLESGGQELSYTHYTPINTIYSLRNRYLSVA